MSILFYYSKSANKPAGKGINEYLSPEDNFQELETIPDWRKILSNFYLANFEWEGNIYPSVEHAFQAKKISLVDSTKAKLFIVGNSIGNESADIARKNRKLCILSKQLLDEWDLIKDTIMTSILQEKFSQIPIAKHVLLATNQAQLWHGTRGIPKRRQFNLEKIRDLFHGKL